jgi:hypothetical protein
MTSTLMQWHVDNCSAADLSMPWMIRQKAQQAGLKRVAKDCLNAAANVYALRITSAPYTQYEASASNMTLEEFEELLCRSIEMEKERNWVRTRVYQQIADLYYWRGERSLAKQFYGAGLRKDWRMPRTVAKYLLLSLGNPGDYLRRIFSWKRTRKEIGLG